MGAKFAVSVTGPVGAVGDYATIYQYFMAPPPDLTTAVRAGDFQALVDQWTESFVGREFVFTAIQKAIDDPGFRSGYIVIQGEPGIGKTAVLAQYVKRNPCVHHFYSRQGVRATSAFLENVCAQLMIGYDLGTQLPPRTTQDSGELSNLLGRAAKNAENRPVIVAVDALDEADHADGIMLPGPLPEGVFFVVSMRNGTEVTLGPRRRDIYIDEGDPLHLDVGRFIDQFVDDHDTMRPRIAEWKVTPASFRETLVKKSEGNFMYLVQVLGAIHEGTLTRATIDDVSKLPKGLTGYYNSHWDAMKKADPVGFDNYVEPVVCLLVTVREPVSEVQLVEWMEEIWTDVPNERPFDPGRIAVVVERWRPFLNEVGAMDDRPRYRIYHASLGDYIKKRKVHLSRYHAAIARRGLGRIGELHAG